LLEVADGTEVLARIGHDEEGENWKDRPIPTSTLPSLSNHAGAEWR
jgi:hypothetical protein